MPRPGTMTSRPTHPTLGATMTTPIPAVNTNRPMRRLLWLVAGIAVVVGATFGGITLAGGFSHATQPPKPTFTLHGSITLLDPNAALSYHIAEIAVASDYTCHGTGPFSDLSAGTAVVVADPQGHTIATGALRGGTGTDGVGAAYAYGAPVQCVMGFSVPDVPDGLASYSVTVSHRGTQVVPQSEAHSGVALTIGGN